MSLLAETKRRVMPATNFAQVFDNFSLYKLWYVLQIPEAALKVECFVNK